MTRTSSGAAKLRCESLGVFIAQHIPCRSEPARDSGCSANEYFEAAGPSRAGSLLQGFCVFCEVNTNPVASELARVRLRSSRENLCMRSVCKPGWREREQATVGDVTARQRSFWHKRYSKPFCRFAALPGGGWRRTWRVTYTHASLFKDGYGYEHSSTYCAAV